MQIFLKVFIKFIWISCSILKNSVEYIGKKIKGEKKKNASN